MPLNPFSAVGPHDLARYTNVLYNNPVVSSIPRTLSGPYELIAMA